MNLCAVSVDLDEVHHYERIHGLSSERSASSSDAGRSLVYDVALPRAVDFAERLGVPLTLFAVGRDLSRPASATALRAAISAGHLAENHSLGHRYDLTRLTAAEMRAEVVGGADAIEEAVGRRPVGFRAPGYVVNDALFDVLEALALEFDSSVMSSPPYFGAKALARAVIATTRRPSVSVQDDWRVLRAPREPYRPGRPYFARGSRRLIELPIQVTPRLGLPIIGTSLSLLGQPWGPWLATRAAAPLVNLELHAIDFLDVGDGLSQLAAHQPELRIPWADRSATLRAVVGSLATRGAELVSLVEATRRLASSL